MTGSSSGGGGGPAAGKHLLLLQSPRRRHAGRIVVSADLSFLIPGPDHAASVRSATNRLTDEAV